MKQTLFALSAIAGLWHRSVRQMRKNSAPVLAASVSGLITAISATAEAIDRS
jgi:hypothetical protein